MQAAQKYLRAESARFEELVALAGQQRDQRYFSYARRLYQKARIYGDKRRQGKLLLKETHCTYRAPDLPAEIRFS